MAPETFYVCQFKRKSSQVLDAGKQIHWKTYWLYWMMLPCRLGKYG